MDARFEWRALPDDDAAWGTLFPPTPGEDARVVNNTIAYLRHRAGAKSVLVENNYVDRDHRAAFSHFYSRQFRGTSSLCQRLHFFSSTDPWDALKGSAAPPADSYRGYVIRRPAPSAPIGRSLLAVDPSIIPGVFAYCRGLFEPHVNEVKLGVQGVPFSQQDSMVMSCAETSIWTAARIMSKQFRHPLILPNEITRPETIGNSEYGRLLPSNGLTANQMAHALSTLGFEPIHYDKGAYGRRAINAVEKCVPYLVSRIPVIIAFPDHAVTACGVVVNPDRAPISGHSPAPVHEWVDGLLIQDDSRGPYRIVPRDEEQHVSLHGTSLQDLLITRIKDPTDVTYPSWFHGQQAVNVIVPLPDRVYLTAEDVHVFARTTLSSAGFIPALKQMLELLVQADHPDARTLVDALFNGKHGGIVYSVRCRKATEVREEFTPAVPRIREIMRDVPLPRQVWAIEFTTHEAFASADREKRVLFGEFYLDATAHKYVGLSALVAARVVGAMLVRPRLCQGDDTPKILSIPEDSSYFRGGIPLWSD